MALDMWPCEYGGALLIHWLHEKFYFQNSLSPVSTWAIKVIRKVRKRRHPNPVFGHIGDEISKNSGKSTLGFNGL